MSSPQTTAQNSHQHSHSGFADRSSADRRSHLRAVPDRDLAPNRAADCDDNCHYCQGPETD